MKSSFYRQTSFHRRVIPMTSRKRCTICRDYFLPQEMTRVDNLTHVCSSECLSVLMGKRRTKKRERAVTAKPRRDLTPKIAIEVRAAVHIRDHNRCRMCGAKGTQCHHIVYRSHGGSDDLANLILLCSECHLEQAHGPKSRRYRELFLAYVWLRTVEGLSLSIPEVEARLQHQAAA